MFDAENLPNLSSIGLALVGLLAIGYWLERTIHHDKEHR